MIAQHGFTMVTNKPGDTPDDSSLLKAASNGDQAAFAQLFDRHVRPVFYQAFSVVRDADAAQDIVQDAYYTLWRKRDSIHVVDASVLPWLMVTARNLALNAHRKAQRNSGLSLVEDLSADSSSEPAYLAETSMVAEQIEQAVAKLSPLDRQLFESCIAGELSYEQAAEQAGVTHGAVRNRLSRIKQRLRGDLADLREES